jgi:hypothetical protein
LCASCCFRNEQGIIPERNQPSMVSREFAAWFETDKMQILRLTTPDLCPDDLDLSFHPKKQESTFWGPRSLGTPKAYGAPFAQDDSAFVP